MEKVTLVLSLVLIEFIVDVIVLKIFKVYYKGLFLMFLQIPKICASVICLLYSSVIWACVLAKLLGVVVCIIFITDSFYIKKLINIFVAEIALSFSVCGFSWFVLSWINSSVESIFFNKIPQKYQILLLFLLFLYTFAIFKMVRFFEKNRFIKNFLAKVSLSLNGKHIVLYGLIDSGNSLFDSLTRKPVVLISKKSLEKNLSKLELENILKNKCRNLKCETVSSSGLEIPIFKVSDFEIIFDGEIKKVSCVVGMVNHEFEKGRFDCLLHRDFL